MSTPPVTREKAPRQRLFYLDLVRALAAILSVVTHFNNPYLMQGHYVLAIEPFGIYVGSLGVSLWRCGRQRCTTSTRHGLSRVPLF